MATIDVDRYSMTDEQASFWRMMRSFADREVAPLADEMDKNAAFPTELFHKLAAAQLMGKEAGRLPPRGRTARRPETGRCAAA